MTTVWGLRSRPEDQLAYQLFVERGYAGIAWARFGNMRLIGSDFDAFADVIKKHWPTVNYGSAAGQCYRFVYVAQPGDAIVYPSPMKGDNTLHLGFITGDYEHNPEISYDCTDLRKVDWRVRTSRDQFSQDQIKSLKSRLTFYEIHENPEAFLSALGKF